MTDDKKGKRDYEVGYKRPPKQSQFQKGHKGYSRGKARAGKKAGPSMTEIVSKRVHTRDRKGNRRSATLLEVIGSELAMKAAKGDSKAVALVFRQLEREGERAVVDSPAADSLIPSGEKPRRLFQHEVRSAQPAVLPPRVRRPEPPARRSGTWAGPRPFVSDQAMA